MTSDQVYGQSKKGTAVNLYFRDKKFTGTSEQAIDNLTRDFEIYAIQQGLDEAQKSLFFINALEDPAREFFLRQCSSKMPFDEIATRMHRHYNSDSRKLTLQSEMDELELSLFMQKHQITDVSLGLKRLVDFINALAPQLFTGFGDDKHKTRYLRRAVMRFDWAKNPLAQLVTAHYSFEQFTTALHESIQL